MAYVRKTEDEFQIHMYSERGGWEEICSETTRKAGLQTLRDYRINAPEFQYKMVKRRVKKVNHEPQPNQAQA